MSERIAEAARAWAKTWSAWDLAGDDGGDAHYRYQERRGGE